MINPPYKTIPMEILSMIGAVPDGPGPMLPEEIAQLEERLCWHRITAAVTTHTATGSPSTPWATP